jgi:hypothetical protein
MSSFISFSSDLFIYFVVIGSVHSLFSCVVDPVVSDFCCARKLPSYEAFQPDTRFKVLNQPKNFKLTLLKYQLRAVRYDGYCPVACSLVFWVLVFVR